ncbi:CoA ester lyase [Aromatoleum toluolicum]|uniref:CoA ester lyase n=1 Tax=Aromatoleum toluolicum TaxID=90060 RepID=A0ABX1NDY4_9RHOO|nr:CoA ester lyase [Aromatoleum toluolicum]NMF97513.1 CoA ester lyase [Aromatoleum toluolicum]
MQLPITYLFVPGNRPERFDKAFAAGAGAIVLDLEDAVAPADKARARDAIADWFPSHAEHAERVVVRINDTQSTWFGDDLALLKELGVTQVMLPKTEWPAQIARVIGAMASPPRVLPLIETARGVRNVDEIAAAEGVQRLVFGTLDYAADLDLSGDETGLIYPSARIAIASRCAELAAPVAGVTPGIDDEARIAADFAFARAFGFGAKLCIHPKQVAVIHAACRPSAAEKDWAERVLAAAASSDGAVQLDGKMIDRPVVLKAQAILARCTHGG